MEPAVLIQTEQDPQLINLVSITTKLWPNNSAQLNCNKHSFFILNWGTLKAKKTDKKKIIYNFALV